MHVAKCNQGIETKNGKRHKGNLKSVIGFVLDAVKMLPTSRLLTAAALQLVSKVYHIKGGDCAVI